MVGLKDLNNLNIYNLLKSLFISNLIMRFIFDMSNYASEDHGAIYELICVPMLLLQADIVNHTCKYK